MLSRELLVSEIRKLTDPYHELFEGYPETCFLAAERWSKVMSVYATDITPPTSGISSGELFMRNKIMEICGNESYEKFVTDFTLAITLFTQQVASGMILVFPHRTQGIMPPQPLNIRPAFEAGMAGASGVEFAEIFAEIIDSWYRTGTARDIITNVTVFWS